MKLALAVFIAILTFIGNPHYSKANPVTCDMRGCSDWNQSHYAQSATKVAHKASKFVRRVTEAGVRFLPHPKGCPRVAFCACGAAVEVFGEPKRSLWPARAWFKFPSTHAAPGAVAVRSHHVFVLVRQIDGNQWLVKDFNSGGHKSREWVRSISGYKIVDPRRGMASL